MTALKQGTDVETLRWSVSPHPDGPPGRLYKCAGATARSTGILPVASHGQDGRATVITRTKNQFIHPDVSEDMLP